MREAAHLMVANLAGNLSLVTCKEPLRNSMAKQMQDLLTQQPIAMQLPKQTLERIIQQCVNDNLKLGCSLIVKATSEKAKVEVDARLKNQYSVRRATRRRGQQYYDMSISTGEVDFQQRCLSYCAQAGSYKSTNTWFTRCLIRWESMGCLWLILLPQH